MSPEDLDKLLLKHAPIARDLISVEEAPENAARLLRDLTQLIQLADNAGAAAVEDNTPFKGLLQGHKFELVRQLYVFIENVAAVDPHPDEAALALMLLVHFFCEATYNSPLVGEPKAQA
jgi:hypothetical protein